MKASLTKKSTPFRRCGAPRGAKETKPLNADDDNDDDDDGEDRRKANYHSEDRRKIYTQPKAPVVRRTQSSSANKKSWSPEEDARLNALIGEHGCSNWNDIGKRVAGRTGKQCRERYHNHLKPHVRKKNWSPSEDSLILSLQKIHGNAWSLIASKLSGRTDNAVKNRWWSGNRSKFSRVWKKTETENEEADEEEEVDEELNEVEQDGYRRSVSCSPPSKSSTSSSSNSSLTELGPRRSSLTELGSRRSSLDPNQFVYHTNSETPLPQMSDQYIDFTNSFLYTSSNSSSANSPSLSTSTSTSSLPDDDENEALYTGHGFYPTPRDNNNNNDSHIFKFEEGVNYDDANDVNDGNEEFEFMPTSY